MGLKLKQEMTTGHETKKINVFLLWMLVLVMCYADKEFIILLPIPTFYYPHMPQMI